MTKADKKRGKQNWLPQRLDDSVSPYLALLKQLEESIETGALSQGDRLPPHRTLATQSGVSIATVTKAYLEAQRRGLVEGQRGRGMFVTGRSAQAMTANAVRPADLGYNLAPEVGQSVAIYAAMDEIVRSTPNKELMTFSSYQGIRPHRHGLAHWLQRLDFRVDPDLLFITNGAQQGAVIAASLLRRSADEPVMVEEISYTGWKALASTFRFPLVPVAMDKHGVIPEDLQRVALETGARTIFITPTLQSPTAITMPIERRQAIAKAIGYIDGFIVEDDVYAHIPETPIPPISSIIPDRAIYLNSFSKVLSLGFRVGIMVVPEQLADAAILAMRATSWISTSLATEVVVRLLQSGELDRLVTSIRSESRARSEIFQSVFDYEFANDQPRGFHVWLPIPTGRDASAVCAAARDAGIILPPPGFTVRPDRTDQALRLCLSDPSTHEDLKSALEKLKAICERAEQRHVLML